MTPDDPSPTPLRERRRRQTSREIQVAALRLAGEHGFAHLSVEMIAAEAGVSRRTFFNYFPNKEAAVLSGPPHPAEDTVEAFVSAGPGDPQQILADLVELLVSEVTADQPRLDEFRSKFDVAGADPHLQAALSAGFDAFRRHIAGVVARRMGQTSDDQEPNLIAGMALATVFSALESWSAQSAGEESPVPHLERAVELLRSMLALEAPGRSL